MERIHLKKISQLIMFVFLVGVFTACENPREISIDKSINPNQWEGHYAEIPTLDSLQSGKTYLSIYSHIYSFSMGKSQELTAMVSLRNMSETDTVYISKANYYSTKGALIRQYLNKPFYLKPLETVEIVIDETDEEGGSGANFIFDWTAKPNTPEPFFEAIMTSLRGSQGLSFTTTGRRIN